MNKNGILILSILFIFTSFTDARSRTQFGFIADVSCLPFGYGTAEFGYADGAAGSVSTQPEGSLSNSISSAGKYSFGAGFFYGVLQADLSYSRTEISGQRIQENVHDDPGVISGGSSFWEAKAGRRWSNPGDVSYSWIYAGIKRMSAFSDFEDSKSTCLGYTFGYEGLYSFGYSNFEFAVQCSAYLGTYRKVRYNSDSEYTVSGKANSLTAGAGLGAGVYLEPYNVILLFKISSEIDHVSYKADINGSEFTFGNRTMAHYAGIEAVYILPNFKYNRK